MAAPTISYLNPLVGAAGATVNVIITGTGFGTVTAVDFGGGATVNSFTIDSATQLTASVTVAAVAGYYDLTVTNPDGDGVASGWWAVVAAPTPPGYLLGWNPVARLKGICRASDGTLYGVSNFIPNDGLYNVVFVYKATAVNTWALDYVVPLVYAWDMVFIGLDAGPNGEVHLWCCAQQPIAPPTPYWSLHYVKRGGVWSGPTTIWDSEVSTDWQAMRVDGNGTAHFAGVQETDVTHVSYCQLSSAGVLSSIETVAALEGATFTGVAMAIDGQNRVHLVLSDLGGTYVGLRYFIRDPSTGWGAVEVITSAVAAAFEDGLAIDLSGNPHLAYLEGTNVWYMTRGGTGWSVPVQVTSEGIGYPVIALDRKGAVYVTYGKGTVGAEGQAIGTLAPGGSSFSETVLSTTPGSSGAGGTLLDGLWPKKGGASAQRLASGYIVLFRDMAVNVGYIYTDSYEYYVASVEFRHPTIASIPGFRLFDDMVAPSTCLEEVLSPPPALNLPPPPPDPRKLVTLGISTVPVAGRVTLDGRSLGVATRQIRVPVLMGAHLLTFGAVSGYTTPNAMPLFLTDDRDVVGEYSTVPTEPPPVPPATPPPVGYATLLLREMAQGDRHGQALTWMEFWLDGQHRSHNYFQHYENVTPGTHKVRWAEQFVLNGYTWLLVSSRDTEVTVAAGEQKVIDAYYAIQLPTATPATPPSHATPATPPSHAILDLKTEVLNPSAVPAGQAAWVQLRATVDGVDATSNQFMQVAEIPASVGGPRRAIWAPVGTRTVGFSSPDPAKWDLVTTAPVQVSLAAGATKVVVGQFNYKVVSSYATFRIKVGMIPMPSNGNIPFSSITAGGRQVTVPWKKIGPPQGYQERDFCQWEGTIQLDPGSYALWPPQSAAGDGTMSQWSSLFPSWKYVSPNFRRTWSQSTGVAAGTWAAGQMYDISWVYQTPV